MCTWPRCSTRPGGCWRQPASRPRPAAMPGWRPGPSRSGTVDKVGMEGTGSFGAGLLRFLADYGLTVIEVDRPDRSGTPPQRQVRSARRRVRRPRRPVRPGHRHTEVPRRAGGDDPVLRVARRGAMKARIQAGAQLDALIVTAPEPVRAPLRKLTSKQRIRACAALRPGPPTDPTSASSCAALPGSPLAGLQAEIDDLDAQLTPLVTAVAPELLALPGVGVDTAGQLLVTAGDNPRTAALRSDPSPGCAAPPRSRCPPDAPTGTGCTAAATATPTAPCGASPWSACAATSPPRTTSPAAPPKARPRPRSCAASSATSPARSIPHAARSDPGTITPLFSRAEPDLTRSDIDRFALRSGVVPACMPSQGRCRSRAVRELVPRSQR